MNIFEICRNIGDMEIKVQAIFGMGCITSYAEGEGCDINEVFNLLASFASQDNETAFKGIDFAKKMTYYGHVSYCYLMDLVPYSKQKVMTVFDDPENIVSNLTRFTESFTRIMPTEHDLGKETKKK